MMEIYECIFETVPDALLIVDREGRMVRANTRAESMFGYHRSELIGRSIEILIPQWLLSCCQERRSDDPTKPCASSTETGREGIGLYQDGSAFPIDMMLHPMDTEEGLVLCTVRDNSKHKQAEETLRLLEAAIQQGNEAV